jgi:hypothetical protein
MMIPRGRVEGVYRRKLDGNVVRLPMSFVGAIPSN